MTTWTVGQSSIPFRPCDLYGNNHLLLLTAVNECAMWWVQEPTILLSPTNVSTFRTYTHTHIHSHAKAQIDTHTYIVTPRHKYTHTYTQSCQGINTRTPSFTKTRVWSLSDTCIEILVIACVCLYYINGDIVCVCVFHNFHKKRNNCTIKSV